MRVKFFILVAAISMMVCSTSAGRRPRVPRPIAPPQSPMNLEQALQSFNKGLMGSEGVLAAQTARAYESYRGSMSAAIALQSSIAEQAAKANKAMQAAQYALLPVPPAAPEIVVPSPLTPRKAARLAGIGRGGIPVPRLSFSPTPYNYAALGDAGVMSPASLGIVVPAPFDYKAAYGLSGVPKGAKY